MSNENNETLKDNNDPLKDNNESLKENENKENATIEPNESPKQVENQNEEEVAATVETSVEQSSQPMNQPASQPTNQPNPYIEKSKETAKGYWSFILSMLKSPMLHASEVNNRHIVNGSITLGLFALILPLIAYIHLKNTFGAYFDVPFFSTVIQPFFIIALFLVLTSVVIFGVTKLMNQSTLKLTDVIARFGAFNVVSLLLVVAALVLAIIKAISFSLGIVYFAMLTFLISIAFTVYSLRKTEENPKVDPLYGTLLVLVIMAVILAIAGDSLLGQVTGVLW